MVKSVLKDVNNFDTFIISIATDPKNTEAIRNKCWGLLPTRVDYAELQLLDRLLLTCFVLFRNCAKVHVTSSLHVNVCREWGRPENGRIACRCASHAAFTPLSSHKTTLIKYAGVLIIMFQYLSSFSIAF